MKPQKSECCEFANKGKTVRLVVTYFNISFKLNVIINLEYLRFRLESKSFES